MMFAVFILSHKRAERVDTYSTLRNSGYTGPIFIVVDDEDPQLDVYIRKYGASQLMIFRKRDTISMTDYILPQMSSALYARYIIEQMAKHIGLNAFCVMDDDITSLRYRWVEGNSVRSLSMKGGLDDVFNLYANYIVDNKIATASFAHMMFYVGGIGGLDERISNARDTYQIHIRNTKYPVDWISSINEDIITEIQTSKTGYIWWSIPFVVYDALPMGNNDGGNEYYKTVSAIERAMPAVVVCPDCCKIGYSHGKIRILQNRKASFPMIISSRYKK